VDGKKRCEGFFNAGYESYLICIQMNLKMFKTGKVREAEENGSELSWYPKGQGFKRWFERFEEGNQDPFARGWSRWPLAADLEGDNKPCERWKFVRDRQGQDPFECFNCPSVVELAKMGIEGHPERI